MKTFWNNNNNNKLFETEQNGPKEHGKQGNVAVHLILCSRTKNENSNGRWQSFRQIQEQLEDIENVPQCTSHILYSIESYQRNIQNNVIVTVVTKLVDPISYCLILYAFSPCFNLIRVNYACLEYGMMFITFRGSCHMELRR